MSFWRLLSQQTDSGIRQDSNLFYDFVVAFSSRKKKKLLKQVVKKVNEEQRKIIQSKD